MKTIIVLLAALAWASAAPTPTFRFPGPRVDSVDVGESEIMVYKTGKHYGWDITIYRYREAYKVIDGKIRHVRNDTAKITPAHMVPETVVWP